MIDEVYPEISQENIWILNEYDRDMDESIIVKVTSRSMRKENPRECTCTSDNESEGCNYCLEKVRKFEIRMHQTVKRLCKKMLGVKSIPMYSKYTPVLDHLMPMEAYESLITKDGMHLEKFIRLVAVGMMKIFG